MVVVASSGHVLHHMGLQERMYMHTHARMHMHIQTSTRMHNHSKAQYRNTHRN